MGNVPGDGQIGKGAKRAYDASGRQARAAATRVAILEAARALFLERGYPATTIAGIASAAGVNPDTVYAAIGPKPALFRLLIETAISGTDDAVPAEQRAYVQAIRAEPDARKKLERYARALRSTNPRLAPLLDIVRSASASEPELRRLWGEINDRRARNMRLLARDLMATGAVRPGLSVDDVAMTVWLLAGSDTYLLITRDRGWSDRRYERWLAATWQRALLVD